MKEGGRGDAWMGVPKRIESAQFLFFFFAHFTLLQENGLQILAVSLSFYFC